MYQEPNSNFLKMTSQYRSTSSDQTSLKKYLVMVTGIFILYQIPNLFSLYVLTGKWSHEITVWGERMTGRGFDY